MRQISNVQWRMSNVLRPLPRSYCVSNNVVHGELDELRTLLAAALALGPNVGEAPFDVRDFASAELVLQIEVLRNQRLDLVPDRGTVGFAGCSIGTLLRPRVGFQSEQLSDELRAHAVALVQLLHHIELHGQLRDLHPVLVEGLVIRILRNTIDYEDWLVRPSAR